MTDIFDNTLGLQEGLGMLEERFVDQEFQISDLETRINLILTHLGIEDPDVSRAKFRVKHYLKRLISENLKRKKRHSKKRIISLMILTEFNSKAPLDINEIEKIYDSIIKTEK